MRTIDSFMTELRDREPDIPLFHQAVESVAKSVWPHLRANPRWEELRVFERLMMPDRELRFRVEWVDDDGGVHVDEGWRIQQSDLLGPYKGGLRFTPDLDRSTLRFLAFEQAFKGALTGLPLGGAKGGATFDPHGRSESEVMRFCQAFMLGLARHVGPHLDVPAGDMNVGARELGYLFGAYRKVTETGRGALTGKPVQSGGIPLREEATGYGLVYATDQAMARLGEPLEGASCAVSGAGNVALHTAAKLIELGAKCISLSDTSGTLHVAEGLARETLREVMHVKSRGGHLDDVAGEVGGEMRPGTPWSLGARVALPCATQNELDESDAQALVEGNAILLGEGANMPCTAEAVAVLEQGGVVRLPGKLSNAGGVTVSGFEMAQGAQLIPWTREEVDSRLRERMKAIHADCVEHAELEGEFSYERGANVASFLRLARALEARGVI